MNIQGKIIYKVKIIIDHMITAKGNVVQEVAENGEKNSKQQFNAAQKKYVNYLNGFLSGMHLHSVLVYLGKVG